MEIIPGWARSPDGLPTEFLPARHSKRGNSYGNVAGSVAGWLAVTAGIVSKRLNLS